MPPKGTKTQNSKRSSGALAACGNETDQRKQSVRFGPQQARGETSGNGDVRPQEAKPQSARKQLAQQEHQDVISPAEFSQQLQNDRKLLLKAAQTFEAKIAEKDKTFTTAFTTQIRSALTLQKPNKSSLPDLTVNDQGKSKSNNPQHPLWDQSLLVVRHARGLQKRFDQACQAVNKTHPGTELGTGWREDLQCLQQEIDIGSRVAERHIARVLERDGMFAKAPEVDAEAQNEEKRAASVLGMSVSSEMRGVSGSLTLADTIKYAERGVKRLVRGLPVEETAIEA